MLSTGGDVYDHTSRNVRQSTCKAQKKRITTEEHFDAETYWGLTVNAFKKQHSQSPFSKEHFMSMLDMINQENLGEVWVAKVSLGGIVAADVIVCDSKVAHRWSASASEEHPNTGAHRGNLASSWRGHHALCGSRSSINLI